MIKTFFYLKTDKQNEEGDSPIYAKIELQGKKTTLNTGKFINKDRWAFTNKLRNKLRLDREKNCRIALDLLESKIENACFELTKNNINATLIDVKNKLNGNDTQSTEVDIITLFKKHNEYFKRKFKAGERSKASLQKYNRAKDLLTNYIKVKHGKNSFDINNIDNQFVYNLESYLRYESTFNNIIGISHNSVVKYFQCFKTACKYGVKRNLITNNPFMVYDEKLVIKDAIFLTKDELERIEAKEFSSERLNKVKDIFLFSCYTSYAEVPYINSINNTNKLNNTNIKKQASRSKNETSDLKNQEDTSKQKKLRQKNKSMVMPNEQELIKYFQEQNFPELEAKKFFNYFSSNGWLVGGKTPMANWKAAAQNWMINSKNFNAQHHHNTNITPTIRPKNLSTSTNKNYSEPL